MQERAARENETLTVVHDQCIVSSVMADERRGIDPDGVEALLFDLDGTLMDTDDQMVESLALRLQRLGRPEMYRVARWFVTAAEGPANALLTALDVLGLDAPLLGFWKWLNRWRQVTTPDYRLMEGAREALAELRSRYRLAVVTTRGLEDAEAFLEQHDLRDMFDAIVTRETTWRLKPHPEPIRKAARLLGVPVERCVMVGDTTVDVKSAQRAGARAVAVACGFGTPAELEQAGANVVLDGIPDLTSVL